MTMAMIAAPMMAAVMIGDYYWTKLCSWGQISKWVPGNAQKWPVEMVGGTLVAFSALGCWRPSLEAPLQPPVGTQGPKKGLGCQRPALERIEKGVDKTHFEYYLCDN